MGLEFFTGFEGCNKTNDILYFFDNSSYILYSSSGGFNNGKSLKVDTHDGYFVKNITGSLTKVVGFHVNGLGRYNSISYIRYNLIWFYISGGTYIKIANYSDGIRVYRDSTLIASCGSYIPSNLSHIEIKLYSHSSAGYIQIKLNGDIILNATGLNTIGNNITGNIQFAGCYSDSDVYYDNIYIADDDFKGELISQLCLPISDNSKQFTPSTGTDNFEMVNDIGHDSDSTYVEADTIDYKDLYEFTDIDTNLNIAGVSIVTVARKDDAGDRSLGVIGNQDASDYNLGSHILSTVYPSTYGTGQVITLATAPDTSAWTPTIFNAMKWGYKVI